MIYALSILCLSSTSFRSSARIASAIAALFMSSFDRAARSKLFCCNSIAAITVIFSSCVRLSWPLLRSAILIPLVFCGVIATLVFSLFSVCLSRFLLRGIPPLRGAQRFSPRRFIGGGGFFGWTSGPFFAFSLCETHLFLTLVCCSLTGDAIFWHVIC